MSRPRSAFAAALAALLVVTAAACSSDAGSDDVEQRGLRTRAVQVLMASNLPEDQADCIVDELGADTVVEAPDVGVLTDSQQYQDAAKVCIP